MDHHKASGKNLWSQSEMRWSLAFSPSVLMVLGKIVTNVENTPTHRIFLTKLISGKTSINCVPFLQISVINCDTIHKRMWHHFSKPSASLASQKPTLQFWPPWFWNLTNSSCVNLVKAGATQLDKGQKGQFSLLLAPLCLVSLHCTCCLWKTQFLMGVAFFTL